MRPALIPILYLKVLLLIGACAPYSDARRQGDAGIAGSDQQRSLLREAGALHREPLQALGTLLDFAHEAALRLGMDPGDRAALADYNFAVARVVEAVADGGFEPWRQSVSSPSAAGPDWELATSEGSPCPQFQFSDFAYRPADRYEFRGELIKGSAARPGIGAPVIAVGRSSEFLEIDSFAQGEEIFYGLTAVLHFEGSACRLEFYDPLAVEVVRFAGGVTPLAADFKAPLALKLAEMHPRRQQLSRMFRPRRYNGAARLARLQPYSPERIRSFSSTVLATRRRPGCR